MVRSGDSERLAYRKDRTSPGLEREASFFLSESRRQDWEGDHLINLGSKDEHAKLFLTFPHADLFSSSSKGEFLRL